MSKVLIFAGTTEGREIAEFINSHGLSAHVCVTTEYGEKLLPVSAGLTISHEQLSQEQIKDLIMEIQAAPVIDATHPYATEVTDHIRHACEETNAEYLRLIRESISSKYQQNDRSIYVESVKEAVSWLNQTKGNIFITTGSKEIEEFTRLSHFRERAYIRVLPLPEVAGKCIKLGFEGKHLICMQGPFSKDLNMAMLKQLKCHYLVTKESGRVGGFQEKWEAASECGCILVIIGRPEEEEGLSIGGCKRLLQSKFNLEHKPQITLVGIGMGNSETLTAEARHACEQAELIIGARRAADAVLSRGQAVYYAYQPEKIRTYIREHPEYEKIVIALSGDVGFYSGAKKLKTSLSGYPLRIICGVSVISYFMARLGKSWEDVCIVSAHGKMDNVVGKISRNQKVFLLTGTSKDVADLAAKLVDYRFNKVTLFVGEQLSYPDERIITGHPCDFVNYQGHSLSVIYIENPSPQCIITHGINDGKFLRDHVPMTKEEIRIISLSKLGLTKNAVCYDIGAGTGSVSIEMALQASEGHVYAIEKNPLAIELIKRNKIEFAVDNLTVIEGLAPEAIKELPVPTHVFIGGTSGHLREVIGVLLHKNPYTRIVINCITLETISKILECIKDLPVSKADIATISVSKAKMLASCHMMQGENPITVVSCQGDPSRFKKGGGME